MVEFAIVAPVFFLLVLGIFELGRLVYVYNTLQGAAVDAARVAIRYSTPLPSDADVEQRAQAHAASLSLATGCPNGAITNPTTANTGYIYITGTPSQTVYNAPGGASGSVPAGCSAIQAATGNVELKVTIVYYYRPATPILADVIGNTIMLTAQATMRTEY